LYPVERTEKMKDNDRLFICKKCGQAVQGFKAMDWFDCGCGDYRPRELTEDEYREVYGPRHEAMVSDGN